MKITKNFYRHILFFLILILSACINKPYLSELDPSAGFNGSFEKIKHGLPLNWYIYSPDEFQKSYQLIIDTADVKEGKQSLKFEIQKSDTLKIPVKIMAPGMFGSMDAEIGKKYKVSFWIKNQGSEFNINVGNQFFMTYSENILKTNANYTDWTYFEYEYTVPESNPSIYFGLNFLSPGTFWIDDVKLEKLNE